MAYCHSDIIANAGANWRFDLSIYDYAYDKEYFRCAGGGDANPAANLLVNAFNNHRVNVDDYLSLTRIRHKASDERLVQLLRRAAKAAAEQAGLRQIRGVADLYDLVNDGMPAFVEVLKEG